MLPIEARQRFSRAVTLGTSDSSQEVMPAVTDGIYAITSVILTCLVSASQTVYVGDSSGNVKALSLGASFPAHSQAAVQLINGLELTSGESIVVKPGNVGPSFHAVVEGYLLKNKGAL